MRITHARSGGPGGQNVNKVNTKVTIHWPVDTSPSLPEDVRQRFLDRFRRRVNKQGELVIHSQRYRDQERNIADCLEKIRGLLLEVATRPKQRKPTKPTRASKERRLREKKSRSQTKQQRRRPTLD
jgi:ribosome-associated protein